MSADIPPLNHTLLWLAKPEEPIKPVADMRLLLQLDFFPSCKWSLEVVQNSNQIQGWPTYFEICEDEDIDVWLTFHMNQ